MTAVMNEPQARSKTRCSWCVTGNHEKCCRTIRNGKVNNVDRLHTCGCTEPNCPAQEPRCMDCRNENAAEINIYTMLCEDRDACQDTLAARRASNPVLQQIRSIKEKTMAETAEKKTAKKAAAAPKVGKCLVTGKPTKGGNFLPGMDARYVSLLVTDVTEGKSTQAQAEAKIKGDLGDKHENLLAKFQKSLRLANERAERKAADDKAKAAAKAAKKAPAKKAPAKKAAAKK